MSTVGIIANPASGKDIRRLVAHASVFDNNEKVNILQRILLALDAIGVDEVQLMPDYYALGERALDTLKLTHLQARIIDMKVTASDRDSTEAASKLAEMNVGSIIVLGGDGTNRVVSKGSGDVPIVPISTGTNNVFPMMVEGTVAGMAAGLVAMKVVDRDLVSCPARRLEVYLNGKLADIALIDVVTSNDLWLGARAIWDSSHIKEIVLSRMDPGSIGLSSVGVCYQAPEDCTEGMYLAIGPGGEIIMAPLGPGMLTRVAVRAQRNLSVGDEVQLDPEATTVALDGERELEIYDRPDITVRLTANGPRVVDIRHCMAEAARCGIFHRLARNGERE